MEKEEEAFSFESLVADVGGVLGLFIGFNFLEILQFFIVFGRNSLTEIFKKKKFNRKILNISQDQVWLIVEIFLGRKGYFNRNVVCLLYKSMLHL